MTLNLKKISSKNYFRSENLLLTSEKWATISNVVGHFSVINGKVSLQK